MFLNKRSNDFRLPFDGGLYSRRLQLHPSALADSLDSQRGDSMSLSEATDVTDQDVLQRLNENGDGNHGDLAAESRRLLIETIQRQRMTLDRRIDLLSSLKCYETDLGREAADVAKKFIDTELAMWMEKTSAFHFVTAGFAAVVPLWMLADDWKLPEIRHEVVEATILAMPKGGEDQVAMYRMAVRDFKNGTLDTRMPRLM